MSMTAMRATDSWTSGSMMDRVTGYFDNLNQSIRTAEATDKTGQKTSIDTAIAWTMKNVLAAHNGGGKIMFIGNGGSAGISSHCTTDYMKNGGLRAQCFNDGAQLTCLANDLGYENVFVYPINMHAKPSDLLIAISSGGKSPSITKAVEAAHSKGCNVLTLSGFGADNPLRRMGDMNIYLPSKEYGFVEIGHLAYCHIVLDLIMADRQNKA